MAKVKDGTTDWPCALNGVTTGTITVTMAGDNGFNKVCAGAPRNGIVQDTDNVLQYNVRLPGSFRAGTRIVTFQR